MASLHTSGYKPVAHQAPIVLTARLSSKPPTVASGRKMELKCNSTSMPGMLAFVDTQAAGHSVYPEPEYFVNVHELVGKEGSFSFLGIVQTPGKTHGVMPNYHGAGDTNVVHAGGTMTTFNTGSETIPCNSLVYYTFDPAEKSNRPKQWSSYDNDHCKFPQTLPVKFDDLKGKRPFIIGRAIRTSQPGQQLDLIMAV